MLAGVQAVPSGEWRLKPPAIFVLGGLRLAPGDADFSLADQHIFAVSSKDLKMPDVTTSPEAIVMTLWVCRRGCRRRSCAAVR